MVVPAGPMEPNWCHNRTAGGHCPPATHPEVTLHFRGARVFEAMIANITAPRSAGGKGMGGAAEAILAGCSAGGLGVYLHCDAFAGLLAEANAREMARRTAAGADGATTATTATTASASNAVAATRATCLADAGYFANINSSFADMAGLVPHPDASPEHSLIQYEYGWIFTEMAVGHGRPRGAASGCLGALGRNNTLCFFPEHNLAHTKTPLYMLQSGYDQWHTRNIWFATVKGQVPCTAVAAQQQACGLEPGWLACVQNVDACNATQKPYVIEQHAAFVARLAPMLDPTTPHGGYVYSHSGHCASGGNVNGTSQARIADWYDGTHLFDSKHVDPPCVRHATTGP